MLSESSPCLQHFFDLQFQLVAGEGPENAFLAVPGGSWFQPPQERETLQSHRQRRRPRRMWRHVGAAASLPGAEDGGAELTAEGGGSEWLVAWVQLEVCWEGVVKWREVLLREVV